MAKAIPGRGSLYLAFPLHNFYAYLGANSPQYFEITIKYTTRTIELYLTD